MLMRSRCFWSNFKNKRHLSKNKTFCTVPYVQGQSPERKIREYFYYIDHQGMVSKNYDLHFKILLKNIFVCTYLYIEL